MTQKDMILGYLRAGHELTPVEALRRFGCFRLSERIREIQAAGHVIAKDWYRTPNGARVRRYRLEQEAPKCVN